MKLFAVLLALCAVAAINAQQYSRDRLDNKDEWDKYTDKWDSMDIDAVLSNRRLLNAYSKCVLDQGKCTPEGKELKLQRVRRQNTASNINVQDNTETEAEPGNGAGDNAEIETETELEGQANGTVNGVGNATANGDIDGDADTDTGGDTEVEGESEGEIAVDTAAGPSADADGDADGDADSALAPAPAADADGDTDGDADADINGDGNNDIAAEAEAEGGSDGENDSDSAVEAATPMLNRRPHISESLYDGCKKCTRAQRQGMRKVIRHYMNNEPETWQQMVDRYDPERKYSHKYEKEMKNL